MIGIRDRAPSDAWGLGVHARATSHRRSAISDHHPYGSLFLRLWGLYLILIPFYAFTTGKPQPAHILSVGFMAFFIVLHLRYFAQERDIILIGSIFVIYTLAVNAAWYAAYYRFEFLLNSGYYAYNLALFCVTLTLHNIHGKNALRVTRAALVIALGIQFAVIILFDYRWYETAELGTFANPNQLGYWGILAFACYLVTKQKQKLTVLDGVILAMMTLVVALSLSRAALIAAAMLIIMAFLFQRVTRGFLVLIASLACLFLFMELFGFTDFTTKIFLFDDVSRELNRHTRYDSLEGRGYSRIWEFSQYTFLGAGEGFHERFTTRPFHFRSEIHSSFGTIIFSYGAVGLLMFLGFLVLVFRRAPLRHFAYALPIFAYGLTHQGLRFSMFWVLLGIIAAHRDKARTQGVPNDPVLAAYAWVQRQRLGDAWLRLRRAQQRRREDAREVEEWATEWWEASEFTEDGEPEEVGSDGNWSAEEEREQGEWGSETDPAESWDEPDQEYDDEEWEVFDEDQGFDDQHDVGEPGVLALPPPRRPSKDAWLIDSRGGVHVSPRRQLVPFNPEV